MEQFLLEKERELTAKLPYKAAIFLPTEAIPLEERVTGLQRVLKIWEHDWLNDYSPRLQALRNRYLGHERCFVIGNGPSLNNTNLNLLRDEISFGVNGIFLKFTETEFRPTFYVVEDHLVAEDRRPEINALTGMMKLFPINLAYCLDEGPNTLFFNHQPRVRYPHHFDFSTDASKITYAGCTVTFTCMQLAFYLGFKKIYLIGVDFNYDMPSDLKVQNTYGVSVLDMESDNPNHFHPSYFGKGQRWHDPQVEKMGQAYAEAKKVTEAHNVQIFNATIGGRLEIFPRVNYDSLFPASKFPVSSKTLPAAPSSLASTTQTSATTLSAASLPRVLVLDMTRTGGYSATGQLKQNLFSGWPSEQFLQVYAEGGTDLKIYRKTSAVNGKEPSLDQTEIITACEDFRPEVIYYRPVDSVLHFHEFACQVLDRLQVPLVTHIVDDWPGRLRYKNPTLYKQLDRSFRELLAKSSQCLSICDAMSAAFKARYGVDFTAVANCIDPDDWCALESQRKQRSSPSEPLTIRYVGALADDMNFQSVCDVARVVDELADEMEIRFEIYTTPIWKSKAMEAFSGLRGVSVHDAGVEPHLYRQLLVGCDVLLITYNFDEESVRYVRYSLANKLPECLASAVPLLIYGPLTVATVAFSAAWRIAHPVTARDDSQLRAAIRRFASDLEYGCALGQRAQEVAFENHSRKKVHDLFSALLQQAVTSHRPAEEKSRAALRDANSSPLREESLIAPSPLSSGKEPCVLMVEPKTPMLGLQERSDCGAKPDDVQPTEARVQIGAGPHGSAPSTESAEKRLRSNLDMATCLTNYRLVYFGYSTVRDYTRYYEQYPDLLGPKGDLKDVQRPWVSEMVREHVPKGAQVIDMGGGYCHLASRLMADYEVTVIDPYDGRGGGPKDIGPLRRKYQRVTFLQEELTARTSVAQTYQAVVSTSVVEHIPLTEVCNALLGIDKALLVGGKSIHAINFTVRGEGRVKTTTDLILQALLQGYGLDRSIEDLRDEMLRDHETYYLSPAVYQQWRGKRTYKEYPWRQIGSFNIMLEKIA